MTSAQLIALQRIAAGDCHPHGTNHVRLVRRLADLGLVTFEDCGRVQGLDAERWFALITDKGRDALRRNSP